MSYNVLDCQGPRQGRLVARFTACTVPATLPRVPRLLRKRCVAREPGPPGASGRIGRITGSRIVMKTALPPWQLTTSELAREINALEASPDGRPPDSGNHGRPGALYEERDRRKHLAEHLAETAVLFPDDEPW